jgi:DNA-binding XRE family transcriptional regulator
MRPEDVLSRRQMLRLSVAELARLADVDKHTIHRIEDERHSPVSSTLGKIERALIAEERRVLSHLLALHSGSSLPVAGPVTLLPPVPATPVARPGNGGFSSQERAA